MSSDADTTLIIVGIIAVFLFLLAGPLISIWALNTLFRTDIPVTFWTYLAMVWIHITFVANRGRKSK